MAEAFITDHDRKKIIVHFDGAPDPLGIDDAPNDEVHIGPPIMIWNMEQCSKHRKALREKFYSIVKPHVEIQKANLIYREVGRVENCDWRTNEIPARGLWKTTSTKPSGEILDAAYLKLLPFFSIWILELARHKDWDKARDLWGLLERIRKDLQPLDKKTIITESDITINQTSQDG